MWPSWLALSQAERGCAHEQQLVQALPVPRSLEDALSRRLATMSPAARSTLDLAAVIGQHVDFALLHALAQLDEGVLLAAIKELIAAQLLVEQSAERYGFRHALVREAVYTQLLQRERRALHRGIVAAIVELYADDLDARTADLAYHYMAGEEWEQTLVYAQRAGEQAQARYATYEALEAARDGAVAQGNRALLWRIDAQLGRLYLASRRRQDAVRACAAACALVGELACGVPHECLRAGFQQRAQVLIPLRPCATEREMEKQSFYGLTERERQVAALIAQGKSNGEIAKLLIMSKRTVEKHVANILGKLGATTRAQIVAWAIAMLLNQPLD